MIKIGIGVILGLDLLLCGSMPALARVEGVPHVNIRMACTMERRAGSTPGDRASYRGCLAEEHAARRTLMKRWRLFRAGERRTCRAESRIGGAPSYVALLTCLQLGSGDLPIRPSYFGPPAGASRHRKTLLRMPDEGST